MGIIDIDKIVIDGGTQPRSSISEETVAEYAESMQEGDKFPPVVVFSDGVKYWLADGFHRYHASRRLTFKEIEAEVKSGTRRDAILYSVSANAKHGIRRTNADKRKAVLTLLGDEEWSGWSDREIARRCAVSPDTVGRHRKEISLSESDSERSYTTKHGTTATMDTSNIGKPSDDRMRKEFEKRRSIQSEPEDNGYDLPDNVDPETGEITEEDRAWAEKIIEKRENEKLKRKGIGIGLEKAHEAIAVLKQIPPNDGLLQEGYDTVIQWINYNRQDT